MRRMGDVFNATSNKKRSLSLSLSLSFLSLSFFLFLFVSLAFSCASHRHIGNPTELVVTQASFGIAHCQRVQSQRFSREKASSKLNLYALCTTMPCASILIYSWAGMCVGMYVSVCVCVCVCVLQKWMSGRNVSCVKVYFALFNL